MQLDPLPLVGTSPYGFERVDVEVEYIETYGNGNYLLLRGVKVARFWFQDGLIFNFQVLTVGWLRRYAWPEIGPLPALLALAHEALGSYTPFDVKLPLAAEEVMAHETE
jgi:hypothetical protein